MNGPDLEPGHGGGAPASSPAPGPTPPGHEPPPAGARFMNILRWALFAALLVLAVGSLASYVAWRRSISPTGPGATSGQAAKRIVYQCPMHPTYTSDKPGECPICGMTLEPVEPSDSPSNRAEGNQGSDVPGLASVQISPERVQLIGVRTARVTRRPLGGQLELVGFVSPDESRLRRVQIRVSGWVQTLSVNRTGELVRAGQPLLSIYSPELYQSEREFLIETGARDSMPGMGHEAGAGAAAGQRLKLLGVPDEELERLARERTAATRLTLRSPVTGTVLERGVTEGQLVNADTPLFTVADLSRVWVLADLYEMDFARVRVGDKVRFVADAMPGRALEARVEFIYPTVSSETRTLKVRLALDNRDGSLRPGMYGRAEITGRGGSALSVPAEAVVNTGERSYVFLAHAGGHFEPRMVWPGRQDGDDMQILKGLVEGDTVVASASFLIDSESRLKAAIAGMGADSTGEPRSMPPGHAHGGRP